MALNWNGDEFGGSERLNAAQMDEAYRRFDRNMAQLEGFVRGRTTPSGELAVAALHRIVSESSARAPGGTANDAFRYGVSQSLLEKAGEMRNNPGEFVRYLDTVRERKNSWAIWDQTPLDPLFERSKQLTKDFVEKSTGGPSEWKPFSLFKGQNGAHAFSGGALDALIDEAASTAQDVVRISANPIEASRQFGEMVRSVHKLPDLVKQQYLEAEKLIKAAGMDDYHKGYLTAKTVLIALDVKDMAQTAGKLKHLNNEFKAGRIHNIKDALDAFDQGPPKRRRGDGDLDSPASTASASAPGRRPHGTADLPESPDVPRTKLPNIEQARLVSQAFGIGEPLATNLTREISEWARRTGGKIEDIYNSPGLLYGNSKGNSGLLGEAVMDAAKIPYDQRKAGHIVLADMRDRMPGGSSGSDIARTFESLMPNGSQHRAFRDAVASVDKVLDNAETARWRNSPEGRKTLPLHQQADLLAQTYQMDGAFRTQLRREVTQWAQDKPNNAIENLRVSTNVLVGDFKGPRPAGLAGEAVIDMVSKNPIHRRASQEVLLEIRDELARRKDSASLQQVLGVYKDIANGNPKTDWAKHFDARVDKRYNELLVGTPEGRKTLPTHKQGDLLAEGYGVDPGPFKDQLRREIHTWARNKPENAVENLRESTKTLFGDLTGPRPHGIVGEALIDTVARRGDSLHKRAVVDVLADARSQLFDGKNTYMQVMSAYEDITKPGTPWNRHFNSEVEKRYANLQISTPEGRQSLPIGKQAELLSQYRGVDGPLAGAVSREIESWAAGQPKSAIENLRNSNQLLFGNGSGQRPAGLIGEALVDSLANPTNRKAVDSVVLDLRREAGQKGLTTQQLLERYEQIATPGTAARSDFDQRVAKRQTQLTETPERPHPDAPGKPSALGSGEPPGQNKPRADSPMPEQGGAGAPPGGGKPPTTASPGDQPSGGGRPDRPRDDSPTSPGKQNTLPPASQPGDPLLPYHAVPRGERLQPPTPIVVGGRNYDLQGMTANGELILRPPSDKVRTVPDNAMFVQRPTTPVDLRAGGEVVYSGRSWKMGGLVEPGQMPGVAERSYRLVDPHNDSAIAIVPESRAGEISKRVGREVTYDNRQWEFGGANGKGYVLIDRADRNSTLTVPLDQADKITMRFAGGTEYTLQGLKNGVLRVAPTEPSGTISHTPSPGDVFEARLRNREMEGVYTVRVGENGQLSATGRLRNGTEVTERIQPSDIAPRYVNVQSPDFGQPFQVDAFLHREAETRARSIATERTGLPVRDPNIGSLPQTVEPRVLRGVESLDAQADFIRRHAGAVPQGGEPRLTVFNIGFSNQGEAQRVVDAMVEFRRQHPDARIEVVAERTRFESASKAPGYDEFLKTLRDNRVQLNFFENGDTSRQVIHAKGVIVNDQVQFTTGAVIDGSKSKVDIETRLPPDAAKSFIRYFDEGINGNADQARRQQLLADMSRQGVLVDDSVSRTSYISRTQDALINGAQSKLLISLSDLTNPETTKAIIERVKSGVNVEIQYREMDDASRLLLDQARQQYPDRLRVENISNWDPRPHYNVIVADDKQGYIGTSYLWPNQQQQIHHTRSFENGVLLQGDSVRSLNEQLEQLRRSQKSDLRSEAAGLDGGAPTLAFAGAQVDTVSARPPRPGESNYQAYAQSGVAVENLNASLNMDASKHPQLHESSEKLRVAAAAVAVNEGLRIDAIDLNKPAPNLPGGSLAFVIEQGQSPETTRYATMKMQEVMQTPLQEGYLKLAVATPNSDALTAQQAREQEVSRQSSRPQQMT